ncbi:MAG: trimethylamine---corrinoid protein Co-methyltransferase, partial [Rhodospirillaceae bacterium]|nr:trimethylamine---corrinoid protein Co-methyltransferase [Rhodospirillaceae bacterium]
MTETTRTARRVRRPRESQHLGTAMLGQPPLRNSFKPVEVLSQDQLMA